MAKDILITDSGDLEFKNGDFAIGEADQQSVVLIVNSSIGSWKQFPLVGVGIIQYVGSSDQAAVIRREINLQLERDGFKDVDVTVKQVGDSYDYFVNASRPD